MQLTSRKKLIIIILLTFLIGIGVGFYFDNFVNRATDSVTADDLRLDDQEATIRAIKKVMPAVVSIIVYDYNEQLVINLSTGQQTIEKERVQKGSGSGLRGGRPKRRFSLAEPWRKSLHL